MSVYHPERFHGTGKKANFFEGWYFKFYDIKGANVFAVVPGIFHSGKDTPEESHAFVFVNINGKEQHYFRFPVDSFKADKDRFHVVVGEKNEFSEDGFKVDLEPKEGDDATVSIRGDLAFDALKKWPVTTFSPGVMGPVAFLPGVECYHGIVSMDHQVLGSLVINGSEVKFDGGRGYLEKDWGKQFPSSWVWIQTNLFRDASIETCGPSLFFSAAQVPYMGRSFPGFICGFLDEAGTLHKFTSYSLSKFKTFMVDEDSKEIHVELRNRTHAIEFRTSYDVPMVKLYGPSDGKMELSVPEGLTAVVDITLRSRAGETLFEGRGECGGIEVQGNIEELTKSFVN